MKVIFFCAASQAMQEEGTSLKGDCTKWYNIFFYQWMRYFLERSLHMIMY